MKHTTCLYLLCLGITVVSSVVGAWLLQKAVAHMWRFKLGMTLQEAHDVMGRDYWDKSYDIKLDGWQPERRKTIVVYEILVDQEWVQLSFNMESRTIRIDYKEYEQIEREGWLSWTYNHWQGPG